METEERIENVEENDDIVEQENNSEDEDSDSSDEELADRLQTQELEGKVTANPYHYDSHVQLITILRKLGDLEALQHARERMNKLFPLTEELWLDWLRDEVPLATNESEREVVAKLFERAVKDYLSVEIWVEYIQFSIGGMDGKDGIKNVRSVCDRALTACGLHTTKGMLVWETYREFENALLPGLQPAPGTIPSSEQQKQIDDQVARIKTLFRRQLSVPLTDMDVALEEYRAWLSEEEIDHNTKFQYEKAKKKLSQLTVYEDALAEVEEGASTISAYQTYIEYELEQGDPARIQCIYERALTDNCLLPDLWLQYTDYLETQLKIGHLAVGAYERAVRNCPWAVTLWQGYMRSLERNVTPHEEIVAVMERALEAGFAAPADYKQLWLSCLDYMRRRVKWEQAPGKEVQELKDTFQRAVDYLQQYFSADGDQECKIRQYWARIEGAHCNNMTRAREIWNDIMHEGHGKEAHLWMEYLQLERAYGDQKHCRKLLQRALHHTSDLPEVVCQAYVDYEREEGSLEQLDEAMAKCKPVWKRVNERRAKEAEKENQAGQVTSRRAEEWRQAKPQKKPGKKADFKQKKWSDNKHIKEVPPRIPKKRPVSDMETDSDGFKMPVVPPPKKKRDGEEKSSDKVPENSEMELGDRHDHKMDDRTVFISNLNFSVGEEPIKKIFSKVGHMVGVRIVRNAAGRSRGFGYVYFRTADSRAPALALDRTHVDGRPMYVSPCEDKKDKQPAHFKFQSSGVERNKLFVKNLPFDVTHDALEKIFSEHGKLKDIRMVTYKSGRPKGLAYVEFEDQKNASEAVLKLDGLQIGDHSISVSISNPPVRKSKTGEGDGSTTTSFVPSLGGAPKEEHGSRGKARTQISLGLVPRSLKRKPEPKQATQPAEDADVKMKLAGSGDVETAKGEGKSSLSNQDFRTMLLKQ